ncbi:hypothetical protein CPB84DRAFT_1777102 [Gymnopilus junonius]|uniref:Uncharacterized protein n=1 Tax=Gymnopilus junonius TaxID=109634 RepID=A0A9P5NLP5_GYMJU|nr:hypothetical protein CPB84DRAFT_1777102 [Gymnopilus junonius]
MPPLGEVLITSYFQINPSSRKRKVKSNFVPQQKKHKSHETQALKDSFVLQIRRSKAKDGELNSSESSTAETRLLREQISPSNVSSIAIDENEETLGWKLHRGVSEPRIAHPSSAVSFAYNTMDRFVMKRQVPRDITSSISQSGKAALSGINTPELINSPICPNLDDITNHLIPSSQTQDAPLSPKGIPSAALEEVQLSSSPKKDCLDLLCADDAQAFIMSSQTQVLDALIDIRHQKKICFPWPTQDTEIIPSSQSQEHELTLPCLEIPSENTTRSKPSPQKSEVRSKGFSSISLQLPLFDNIFEEDNSVETSILAPRNDEELSLTESESETDTAGTKEQPGNSLSSPRLAVYPFHPLHGGGQRIVEQDDPQRSESLSSLPLPEHESLPHVVKDFQDMFGDLDDSFPPDFPMSLR